MNETLRSIMEARYNRPYNWCVEPWHRMWRQKNGLWLLSKELTGSLRNLVVLDAGCGDGWYTAKIAEDTNATYGVDISERAISFARGMTVNIQYSVGSLIKLHYPDEMFDVIMSFQVIEHIDPKELTKVVNELHRILKLHGRLLITVPSTRRPLSDAHYQHFTTQTLRQSFEPKFKFVRALGQEKHTVTLHIIERTLQNRFWLLPEFAERFNKNIFLKHWNRTGAEQGQNIVALFQKA